MSRTSEISEHNKKRIEKISGVPVADPTGEYNLRMAELEALHDISQTLAMIVDKMDGMR